MRGKLSAREEALRYRKVFCEKWAVFLKSKFDSPEEAAAFFGKDGATGVRWWSGHNRPTGDVVGYAYDKFPDEAAAALRR